MAFLTGQSWHVLKSLYSGGDPDQGFWHCFADGLNQSLDSSVSQAAVLRLLLMTIALIGDRSPYLWARLLLVAMMIMIRSVNHEDEDEDDDCDEDMKVEAEDEKYDDEEKGKEAEAEKEGGGGWFGGRYGYEAVEDENVEDGDGGDDDDDDNDDDCGGGGVGGG